METKVELYAHFSASGDVQPFSWVVSGGDIDWFPLYDLPRNASDERIAADIRERLSHRIGDRAAQVTILRCDFTSRPHTENRTVVSL